MLKIGKRDKIKVRENFSLVERLKATEDLKLGEETVNET